MCFCAACRQIASEHVDPEQAARSIRAHVSRFCAALRPGVGSDDLLRGLHADDVLHDYVAARVRAAERWLISLAQRHPQHQFFHGPVNYDSAHIGIHGLEGFKRIEVFDADADEDAGDEPEGSQADQPSRVAEALEIGLWFSWRNGADSLVRAVADAVERGVAFFDFTELDETPPETVAWLRQAVRYARRQ
jgi:hypothetical protein